jgi:PhnB protein
MQVNAYLTFRGDCEAAFTFYAESLGGKVGQIFRYAGTSFMEQAPPGWQDKVMHGSFSVGDQVFMGADMTPDKYEQPKGFTLSLHVDDPAEAERVFGLLAKDGTVQMPMQKTFWAARFGTLVDRFGMRWVINGGAGSDH